MNTPLLRATLLLLLGVPMLAQGLRLDLGRRSRGWEPEVSLPWMEFASGRGSKWTLLDLGSGVGVRFPDGPGHGVGRFHTDARVGAEGVYGAFGLLLDFDDGRRPGVGLRLQAGRQFSRNLHLALQWELLVSPRSAVLDPGTRGSLALVAGFRL